MLAQAVFVMGKLDAGEASRLAQEAIGRANRLPDTLEIGGRGRALSLIAENMAQFDRPHAVPVMLEAIDTLSRAPSPDQSRLEATLAAAIVSMASMDAHAALGEVYRLRSPEQRGLVLGRIALRVANQDAALARSTLARAEESFRRAGEVERAAQARAVVAAALAGHYPAQAASLLKGLEGTKRDLVLAALADAYAKTRAQRAQGYAEEIKGPALRSQTFRTLAQAHPGESMRYLRLALQSMDSATTADWSDDPLYLATETAYLSVTLPRSMSHSSMSLLGGAATRLRQIKGSNAEQSKAMMIVSAAMSQVNPARGKTLLREALRLWGGKYIGYLTEWGAMSAWGILRPDFVPLLLSHVDPQRRWLVLFEMAHLSAGTQPRRAKKWLREARSLSGGIPDGSLDVALGESADKVLGKIGKMRDRESRALEYLGVAQVLMQPPARRTSPDSALHMLCRSLRWGPAALMMQPGSDPVLQSSPNESRQLN
jgi:hypothetical protein